MPLVILLFALALEPLAAVRALSSIMGFRRGDQEDKIPLYAADTLLYLGDTTGSLAASMQLIEQYGSYSGFSINWHTSVLLPLQLLPQLLSVRASQLVVVTSFHYLGVIVTPDPRDYP